MDMQLVKAWCGQYDRLSARADQFSVKNLAKRYNFTEIRIKTIIDSKRQNLYQFEIDIKNLWKERIDLLRDAKNFSPLSASVKFNSTEQRMRGLYNEIRSKRDKRD